MFPGPDGLKSLDHAAASFASLSACVCPETLTNRLPYADGGVHPLPATVARDAPPSPSGVALLDALPFALDCGPAPVPRVPVPAPVSAEPPLADDPLDGSAVDDDPPRVASGESLDRELPHPDAAAARTSPHPAPRRTRA